MLEDDWYLYKEDVYKIWWWKIQNGRHGGHFVQIFFLLILAF